jgi:DNA-binding NarL/FixJ family response regulator
MRILVADDTPAVRSAIRRLLHEEKNVQIVGEAANLGELVHLVNVSRPDLILLDWELSGFPGSAKTHPQPTGPLTNFEKRRNVILTSLRKCASQPLIVVLSGHPEAEKKSLAAGADAFVFKGDPPEQLLRTIYALASLS